MTHLTRFSFGTTSAIVTSLAFIVGLSGSSKTAIVASLLLFAVADNVSDSLGLHVFQESDLKQPKVVSASTFSNFVTRLSIVLVFVLLVALLPIEYAVVTSLIYGVTLLSLLSYLIGKERKTSPYLSILSHIAVSTLVIAVSYALRLWITDLFSGV